MEIRRFGPGHRRADGPPGTRGVAGQVLHSDEQAIVTEMAFAPYAMVSPHASPNLTLFVVISGGGYVQVGGARSRVNHGEAVVWPPDVPHGAYTDGTDMRAIVIELLGGAHAGAGQRLVEGGLAEVDRTDTAPTRGEGALAQRQPLRDEYDASEGEPW
jgi:quercetin dioxygenase-like cupin family protein